MGWSRVTNRRPPSTDSLDRPRTITVSVRLFAGLREQAGTGRLEVSLARGSTAGDVWRALPSALSGSAPPRQLAYAVDHVWAGAGTSLDDGAEVALLLPGSGG